MSTSSFLPRLNIYLIAKGLNALQFAQDRGKPNIAAILNENLNDDRNNLHRLVKPLASKKEFRKIFTKSFPSFTLFYFGMVFNADLWFVYKAVLILMYGLIFEIFKL